MFSGFHHFSCLEVSFQGVSCSSKSNVDRVWEFSFVKPPLYGCQPEHVCLSSQVTRTSLVLDVSRATAEWYLWLVCFARCWAKAAVPPGGFAGRRLGTNEGRNRQRRSLKFDRWSESLTAFYLSDSPPSLLFSGNNLPPLPATPPHPRLTRPAAASAGRARSLTCQSSSRADRAFEVGCDQRCSCREPPQRERGEGEGLVMEMLMWPTLKNGLYSPYKKHSLYCTEVQCSKNSHEAISRAVLNISETVWAVFCFLFFSNHFYTYGEFLGLHPFCYLCGPVGALFVCLWRKIKCTKSDYQKSSLTCLWRNLENRCFQRLCQTVLTWYSNTKFPVQNAKNYTFPWPNSNIQKCVKDCLNILCR